MSRRLAVLAAALAAFLSAAAIAGDVVLYSSNSVEAINAVADEFQKKNPGIKIVSVRGSTGAMMQRIKAEAGAPKADIFWSGGFAVLGLYEDLFAPTSRPRPRASAPLTAARRTCGSAPSPRDGHHGQQARAQGRPDAEDVVRSSPIPAGRTGW
jgi:hypothetical protein